MDRRSPPQPPCLPLLVGVAGLLLLSACDDAGGPLYQGEPGTAVPVELNDWVPTVQVQVEGGESAPISSTMMLDTGSPLTVLDAQVLETPTTGSTTVTLSAFGLTFPDYPSVVTELFNDATACGERRPEGLIGGDLLRSFRLGLDYRGKRAFLFDGPGPDPAVGEETEAPQRVDVQVLGGGIALLADVQEQIAVPATRVMVAQTLVEGSEEQAMVDTGASITVISSELLQAIGEADRPVLCCESVITLYGPIKARLSRLRSLTLGPVTVTNLPVVVVDDLQLLEAISREVGQTVRLMVGGSFLRRFAVLLDYPGQRLELSRYSSTDHISADEFVGPGFSFCRGKQDSDGNEVGMVVLDVFEGTDAETQGVRTGAIVVAVDGQSVVGMDRDQVDRLMREHPVGTRVNLTFKGEPVDLDKDVLVEQLLPDVNVN